MSRPVRNINWYSKHKLNPNQKLEGPKKQYSKHHAFKNAPKHSPNSTEQFKNNATKQDWWNCFSLETMGCHNPLESGPVPLSTCGKYKYFAKKAATGSTYMDYFMLFSHQMPLLLFKSPTGSGFVIELNTMLLKKCKTVFVMLLSSEPWTNANWWLLESIIFV